MEAACEGPNPVMKLDAICAKVQWNTASFAWISVSARVISEAVQASARASSWQPLLCGPTCMPSAENVYRNVRRRPSEHL